MALLASAEQVLVDLGITEPAEIDLEAIAWTLGVQIRYRPLNSCEARIVGNGNRAIITVNSRSPPRRRRFSAAHELGHWCCHRGRLLVCNANEIEQANRGRSPQERTADKFAAQLLMPDYLLGPVIRTYSRLTFQAIQTAADIFDTSLTSTAIRVVESRHFPAILICHGMNGLRWFTRSTDIPGRWFPRDNLDAESFAFGVLFGGASDDRNPHKIGADAWFDRWDAERFEVFEQTVRVAIDEILTLVLITDETMLNDQESEQQNRRRRW